jgi:hypothetical protein
LLRKNYDLVLIFWTGMMTLKCCTNQDKSFVAIINLI